jgi:glycosyltransferase involved in cell wall biosynthesis
MVVRSRQRSPGPRRVLIFGINYWPEQLGIAPYTTGLAEHLAATGDDVTVVTGFPHYPEWSLAPEDRRSRVRSETINGVRVVRRRHVVPDRPSAGGRGLYEATFLAHGLGQIVSGKPDVILGVSPSVSGAALAAAASLRFGAPFGLWFQDLSGRAAVQSGVSGGARVAGLVDRVETATARRATAVGVIANGFRSHLEAAGVDPARIRTLRNWCHIPRPTLGKDEARQRLGLPHDALICLHAGNIGQKQGLENIIGAARLALGHPNAPLFVLQGDGNARPALERRAAGLPNLRFLPPQPRADFPNTLAAADILLVNQKPAITDMCLPGKLTSYFAAGRPVVAAVNPDSETARELRRAHAGLIVPAGDPQALLQAIDRLRVDSATSETLVANGLRLTDSELSASAALAALDRFIDVIAAGRAATAFDPAHAPGVAD